jgi:c(7)-type cytochrome triheme protein
MKIQLIKVLPLLSLVFTVPGGATDIANGKTIADVNCVACHATGVMNAPKIGDKEAWTARAKQGADVLFDHAINGVNSMPARGGNFVLKDDEVKNAVAYLLDTAGIDVNKLPKGAAKADAAKAAEPKAGAKTAAQPVKKQAKAKKGANKALNFNRLMKPPSEWNPPPFEDGIHDPDGEGAYVLQAPREAFEAMDKSTSGNRVDWVKSLDNGKINPRYDRIDPDKKPLVMDLNIVREVKGSMPNVVYPHKQHTEWLDCSNCHPDIFIPKKGANQISMAAILMGEKCGVCHGKVAFPVSDCRKCHSQKKDKPLVAGRK